MLAAPAISKLVSTANCKQTNCHEINKNKLTIVTNNVMEIQQNSCICERPTTFVECLDCHFIAEGRLRKECAQHPRTVFLYDMKACPVCSRTRLIEWKVRGQESFLESDSGLEISWVTDPDA